MAHEVHEEGLKKVFPGHRSKGRNAAKLVAVKVDDCRSNPLASAPVGLISKQNIGRRTSSSFAGNSARSEVHENLEITVPARSAPEDFALENDMLSGTHWKVGLTRSGMSGNPLYQGRFGAVLSRQ
jgi:hypothetical protein